MAHPQPFHGSSPRPVLSRVSSVKTLSVHDDVTRFSDLVDVEEGIEG